MRFASASAAAGRPALWVHVTLAGQVLAMAALVLFERLEGGRLARELARFGGDPGSPGAAAVVRPVTLFAVLVLAVAATTAGAATAYLRWLSRALPGRRAAVWVWLVPVVNLIAPPFALHAAWDTAGPAERRRKRWLVILIAWWASWLAALALVLARLFAHAPDRLTGLGVTELAVTALAAALCSATVREIGRVRVLRRLAPTGPYLVPLRGVRSTARHTYPAGK